MRRSRKVSLVRPWTLFAIRSSRARTSARDGRFPAASLAKEGGRARRTGQALRVLAVVAACLAATSPAALADGKTPLRSQDAATNKTGTLTANARPAWQAAMKTLRLPARGCFTASYPDIQWRVSRCLTGPLVPMVSAKLRTPETVGDSSGDFLATVSGSISSATGSFPSVSAGSTETGKVGGEGSYTANTFTLQMNVKPFATSMCSGLGSECLGWEQFIYDTSVNEVYIQNWLINATSCPTSGNWTYFAGSATEASGCFMNSQMVGFSASAVTVANLSSVQLTGSVSAGGNDAVVMTTASGNGSAVESDDTLGLANSWNTVEFDVFGDGNGSEAKFSAGTSISVKTVVNSGSELAPEHPCPDQSFTAETNNLNMAPTASIGTQPSPTVISDQTTKNVTGTPSCASAPGSFTPPPLPSSVLGQWNTTYQNDPRVSIWTSGSDAYTITAETPVEVSGGSSCYIPIGATLATFTGSGTSYSGQHNLFYNYNCSVGGSTSFSLTLDGSTLTGDLGNGGTVAYTKISSPVPSLQSVGLLTFQTYTTSGGKPVPVVRGCAATVVESPNFSTIVTAGHCVAGSSAFGGKTKNTVTDLQFAPGHTGECWDNLNLKHPNQVQVSDCGSPTKQCPQCENPFGVWFANSSDVYSNYLKDNADDFAFILLAPDPTNGPVESIVGGVPITFDKNDGGTSDSEQTQSWAVSGYAADDIDFATILLSGLGPSNVTLVPPLT